jgi:predicted nucleic acid-binding protein
MTRFSLDSNILIYAVDNRDPLRRASAMKLLASASPVDCVLVPQSLAEFFNAVTHKGIMPRRDAAAQIRDWITLFAIGPGPTAACIIDAATGGIGPRALALLT